MLAPELDFTVVADCADLQVVVDVVGPGQDAQNPLAGQKTSRVLLPFDPERSVRAPQSVLDRNVPVVGR
jgi:hypothetical protein